jgi:hypothetical protein
VRHRIGMPLDGGAVAARDLDGAFARLYRQHVVVDDVRGEDPRVEVGFAKRLRDQFGRWGCTRKAPRCPRASRDGQAPTYRPSPRLAKNPRERPCWSECRTRFRARSAAAPLGTTPVCPLHSLLSRTVFGGLGGGAGFREIAASRLPPLAGLCV